MHLPLARRLARPLAASPLPRAAPRSPTARRTLTALAPLRPVAAPVGGGAPAFAPRAAAAPAPSLPDVATAVSSHPALAGQQLRFGRRNVMNGATRLVQKRRTGFLARVRSKTGRKILARRRAKGRRELAS